MLRDRGRPIGSPGRLAALLAALALVPAARANGAFPDEFSIHFPGRRKPPDLRRGELRLLVSEDDGATWRYSLRALGGRGLLMPSLDQRERELLPADRGRALLRAAR